MSVTDQGFIRPTLAEMEQEAKDTFTAKFSNGGQDPVSLEPEDFLGALASLIASIRDEINEDAENLYFSIFVSTANGVNLDRVASPSVRQPAKSSTTSALDYIGTNGTIIPSGTIFETDDGRQYTSDTIVIIAGGVGTTSATAAIAGVVGNAPIGAINFIPVPITGLDTVTNSSPAIDGEDIEDDIDFRARAISERAADNTSSLVSVVNAVANVEGVSSVTGFENIEIFIVDGLPAKSINIVVRGGADFDIATTIFNFKSGGIETFGAESEIITAINGQLFTINFDRVVDVNIFAKAVITVNAAYVDATSDDVIRQNILDYVGGVNPQSVESEGVNVGEDVFSWKAEGTLFDVSNPDAIPGLVEAEVLFGLTVGTTTLRILPITNVQKALIDFASIAFDKTVI